MSKQEEVNKKPVYIGHGIARNTIFNLLGQGLPLFIAFFSIPLLIKGLGTERFGVLTLVWVVIGYASFFDFGLGRALTKIVAEKIGTSKEGEIPVIFWTVLFFMISFGFLGTLMLALLSHWLIDAVIKVPTLLRNETLNSFYLLALSVPIVISSAGLRGMLEAKQRFDLASIMRVFMGAFTYLAPLLVLPFTRSLLPVVLTLVLGRLLTWVGYFLLCFYVMPNIRSEMHMQVTVMKPLLRFGSWMTITNIVGPLMVYLDRFFISAMLSVAAMAYYTTPYELVTKLWIIPGALVGVLFPAFSASFIHSKEHTANLYVRTVKYVFLIMFPITLITIAFAKEGLEMWIGMEFANHSTNVLKWLSVGIFMNSMAQVSFVLVQGVGRPDLATKLTVLQMPIYLLALWLSIKYYGIEGAAFTWALRVLIDTVLFFVVVKQTLAIPKILNRNMISTLIGALLILFLVNIELSLLLKVFFVLLSLSIFACISWLIFLAPGEQKAIKDKFKLLNTFTQTTNG